MTGGEGDVRVWEFNRETQSHLKEHRAKVTGLTPIYDSARPLLERSEFLCWELREENASSSHATQGINAVALSRDQPGVFVGQKND